MLQNAPIYDPTLAYPYAANSAAYPYAGHPGSALSPGQAQQLLSGAYSQPTPYMYVQPFSPKIPFTSHTFCSPYAGGWDSTLTSAAGVGYQGGYVTDTTSE